MYCGNCGVENPDGAKFCKVCGKPLNPVDKPVVSVSETSTDEVGHTDIPEDKSVKTTISKKLIAILAVAVVAIVAIFAVVASSKKTINLDKYVIFEADGYDGYGRAKATIDWDAIEEKYGDKLTLTSAARKEFGGFLDFMTPSDILAECIGIEVSPNTGLSNGDSVEYKWDVADDLDKLIKCKVKYSDGSYTVAGLTEIGTFEAFDDITVEFLDIAPNGRANVNYTGSELSYYDFIIDNQNNLSNGDVVTVSINESNVESYAERLGKVPATLSREYVVDGLESYVSSLADLDENSMNLMKSQAEDVYTAHVAQYFGEGEELVSFNYIGDYLLTTKNPGSWGNNNILYLVYKAQVHDYISNKNDTYDKINEVYWYINFKDLMVASDGTVNVDVTNYESPYDRVTIDSNVRDGWFNKSWYYYGYENLDELYKKNITTKIDSYNHEDSIDESLAPVEVVIEETETEEVSSDFILPNSDKEELDESDLEGLSEKECKIARNEIYARHGRKFKDDELQSYFNDRDWYEGTINPDDFKESDLSDIEIKNKDLIVSFEKKKGYN